LLTELCQPSDESALGTLAARDAECSPLLSSR
jgi:hypothetical protein